MGLILHALQALTLYAVIELLGILYRRLTSRHPFDTIAGPDSPSWVTGNLSDIFAKDGLKYNEELMKKYGSVAHITIPFGEKALLISDPKALYHVYVKDQETFQPSDLFLFTNASLFGDGLLATSGEQHRKQRKMLNPVFSTAHMRNIVPIFNDLSDKLAGILSRVVATGPKEVELLDWFGRVALELIGQSGFGYSFRTLNTEDPQPHPYVSSVKLLAPLLRQTILVRLIVYPLLVKYDSPGKRYYRKIVDTFGWDSVHKFRDLIDVMHQTSIDIFEAKKRELKEGEEATANQIGRGKDLLSVLMKANMESSEKDRLSEDEVIAQISTIVFAGMDTTSTILARVFRQLSLHQDVQDRLREEIKEAKALHGDLDYEQLVRLPYLDAVCRETLRLYPAVPISNRQATQDIILPLSKPLQGTDGQLKSEILVPKGSMVFLSILGCNRSTELWGPDAGEWKPERWLGPLPDTLLSAKVPGVSSHLMTFIGGSRACIGFKFAQLEMMSVMAALLDRLKFKTSDKAIFWNMSDIVTPSIDAHKLKPELPLIVENL
ncbi:cytochrome P450 [Coprinopsis sp. MPI-PUGE-AT-0042]|nr:cytochrome P450 [Coprinopsis sp. MPI-PUGE-AT-0042]